MKRTNHRFSTALLCLLLFFSTTLNGQDQEYQFLSLEDKETLLQGDYLEAYNKDFHLPVYYPRGELSKPLYAQLEEKSYDVVTEVLHFIPLQEISSNSQDLLYLLNVLMQISKQKGIQYFSYRKQALTILIEESYVQSSETDKTSVEDPRFDSIPREFQFYGFQKDWVFGGNTYRYNLVTSENGLRLDMTNSKPLRLKGLVKAFGAGELHSSIIITQADDGLYAYAIAYIEEVSPMVTNMIDVGAAYRKRINAVLDWYLENL